MYKFALTLALIFALNITASAQNDSSRLTNIASKLLKQAATHPVEKAYLQFNKPYYSIGDTIWFKGYVVVGEHHQPSALSGVLYVELIDAKNKVIKTLQLKSNNGISTGDFVLDKKLLPGDYRVRAYTNWMRNSGPDYFFIKTLSIANLASAAVFVNSSNIVTRKGDEKTIKTDLAYTDKFGRAYESREVSYEVRADTNLLYKGSGVTNSKGTLTVNFPGNTGPGQNRISIISHIKLVNGVIVDKTIPLSSQTENADVQFFPEGGQLVNDVRSKVAFKAIGMDGLGIAVKGIVTDNNNNEVAYFDTQHAGMGIFAFTPQNGKIYTATITLPGNTTIKAGLPVAAEHGFVLSVSNVDSSTLAIHISTNTQTLQAQPNASFYVIGQSGGKIYFTTSGKLDNTSCMAVVPKSSFPSGIAQFTLFSAAGEPLNERVAFIKNSLDLLNLDLKTAKQVYAPKEKVDMAFIALDVTNKPIQGNFSLSVFNEDRFVVNENAETTILSNILLTSDLKGYIEEPNYYFNQPSAQTIANLDILMLTQGYHRFEWKNMIEGYMSPLLYGPEKSLSISGQLTTTSGKPIANGKLGILVPSNKILIDTVTDAQGRFVINDVNFADSAKMVIQAKKANDGRNVNITLDNSRTIPVVSKNNLADASLNLTAPFLRMMNSGSERIDINEKADTTTIAANAEIKNVDKSKTLKEVNIKGAKVNRVIDQPKYVGYPLEEYDLDMAKVKDYNTAYDYLKWRVPAFEGYSWVILNGVKYDRRVDPLKTLNIDDIENITYVISHAIKVYPNMVFVTTKSYAGTDTIRVKSAQNVSNNKVLKEVNIFAKNLLPPDKNNNYGAALEFNLNMAQARNYNSVYEAVSYRIPGITYSGTSLGRITKGLSYDLKIPIRLAIINGIKDSIDKLRLIDPADVQSITFIAPSGPAPAAISVTTKSFAGTDTLKNLAGIKNLKQVDIKARNNAGTDIAPWVTVNPNSSNLNGPGHANQVITAKELNSCVQLSDCLITKVSGLLLRGDNALFGRNPGVITFIVDGMMVGSSLASLDMSVRASDVETIEVLKSNSYLNIYGSMARGGALVITTTRGLPIYNEAIAYKSVPGVIYSTFNGFYKAKEFYTPKYTVANSNVTDDRTAVYWNPNLTTDEKGKLPIEFFNSDVKGSYRAVIEGIDNDGNIGRFVYRYRVE